MLGWSPLKQFAEGNGENRNLNGSKYIHNEGLQESKTELMNF